MYRTIMTAVDGSECSMRALEEAIRMARLTRGRLLAVHVIDKAQIFLYAGCDDPAGLLAALRKAGHDILALSQAAMREAGIDGEVIAIETHDIGEDVPSCLQRQADTLGVDLVVLGTHGRRGLSRAVLGSVAERFVRTSRLPVIVTRAARDDRTQPAGR
ncbi:MULTISPECIES: universal stress protein [Burkholderia]|uniref:Universal stress protein n=1 Tax=Burkholderia gladioli TaxID=28095 RepID=A0A0M2QF40_BURGA|nr:MULTISPECIES: universal stress protein [Burkholderia]ATF84180.1 universal stress protein [Burkholderia gladioli pv. gladioli]KAF1061922.1 putative universal stress protein [Burkholderia gladioli]KKJ05177.1 universal stress protein UspA [Burkholderia gladioli]MBA1363258.1 universal stress protein [Burkholderia gladioli]MBJ9713777.1 universal stress protein [Burkholderia gladioli]